MHYLHRAYSFEICAGFLRVEWETLSCLLGENLTCTNLKAIWTALIIHVPAGTSGLALLIKIFMFPERVSQQQIVSEIYNLLEEL